MPDLRIDGRTVSVPEGATVLDGARRLGIPIPTMCHLDELDPSSSCLLCLVRVNGSSRLLPSCATRAEEGMEVESESPEVFRARKMALELLLADHLGECLAPCHRICPLDLDIPRMTHQVHSGDFAAAIAGLRLAVPFPGVLGRVCAAKCEVGCRRSSADDAVSVRSIERHVADRDREGDALTLPDREPDTGRAVAVVGGGPAGLSAAYFLRLRGHAVTVFERAAKVGGRLRHAYPGEILPHDVLDAELDILGRLGVEIRCGVEVRSAPEIDALQEGFDAVLVAAADVPGAAERTGLFTAGDAVRRIDDPARAMASGRDAAARVDSHLSGEEVVVRPPRPFSTVIGKLTAPEISLYLETAEDLPPVGLREEPPSDHSSEEIAAEGGRCLMCACAATETCLLKHYGEQLDADPRRFKVKRRIFTRNLDHPFVVYEPGKCIACGICVTLTREMGEELGLTFIGRGFDVRIGVPFDAPLRDALRRAAKRVVIHCPTGALAFKDRDRT